MNMLATETALSDDEIERIRAAAKEAAAGFPTIKAAADDAGIPYQTFHGFLNGKYQGNNAAQARLLQKWLFALQERAESAFVLPELPGFQPTPTAKRFWSVLQYAQQLGRIGVIAAGAGVGKTTTLETYAAQHPNVWLATMDPSTAGVGTMLRELVDVMGLAEKTSTGLVRAVGAAVKGKRGLILIDEAQHLSAAALETLRSLNDRFKVGLVLAGNETVYARLEGEGRKATFAQLFSRIGMRVTRTKPTDGDVDVLLQAWGVADPQEVRRLKGYAAKPGALRGMTYCLEQATLDAAGAGVPRTIEHITAAWTRLTNEPG